MLHNTEQSENIAKIRLGGKETIMHSRVFIFLSLLSVSLYFLPANSGPDRTTEWLMDENAMMRKYNV